MIHCPHCKEQIDTVDLVSCGTITDPLELETGVKLLVDGSCSECGTPLHSVWLLQEVEIPSLVVNEG